MPIGFRRQLPEVLESFGDIGRQIFAGCEELRNVFDELGDRLRFPVLEEGREVGDAPLPAMGALVLRNDFLHLIQEADWGEWT
jgi:hypothetical protein